MHEAQFTVDDVEVEVQALAVTGNEATTAGERETGGQLDGGEDADQTLRDAIPSGDLPCQVLRAGLGAAGDWR